MNHDDMPATPPRRRSDGKTLGEPIVIIDGVQKSFSGNHVLKDVSLTVRRGEVVVICGRSGSGKSTLLRCIDQLETIDGGTIHAAGHLMGFREKNGKRVPLRDAQIARQQRDLGMVFQNFSLFPPVSVMETITMAPSRILARDGKDVQAEARALLERVGLPDSAPASPARSTNPWTRRRCSPDTSGPMSVSSRVGSPMAMRSIRARRAATPSSKRRRSM